MDINTPTLSVDEKQIYMERLLWAYVGKSASIALVLQGVGIVEMKYIH